MRFLIIMSLFLSLFMTSSNLYASGVDSNIIEIYESDREAIQRDGFVMMGKQKKIEQYQMEVKKIQQEEQEKLKNKQQESDPYLSQKIYKDKINALSAEILNKRG